MENDLAKIIVSALLLIGAGGYLFSVIIAVRLTLKSTPELMPSFLNQIIDSLGSAFSITFGAFLGITIKNNSEVSSFLSLLDSNEKLMFYASILYLISLIISVVGWGLTNFSDDPNRVVPCVKNMSKSLLGIIVGVVGVALGISPTI